MTRQSVTEIESLLHELRYNDAPLSPSTTSNWVARHGGLPPMARAIARAVMRSGASEGHAIGVAIAALKRWAAGGGDVHPSTRARAAAAVAHWEAMKAASHATRSDDETFIEYLLERSEEEAMRESVERISALVENRDVEAERSCRVDRAMRILERRVGPHGYIHGWIKVGEFGEKNSLRDHLHKEHGVSVDTALGSSHQRLRDIHAASHAQGSFHGHKEDSHGGAFEPNPSAARVGSGQSTWQQEAYANAVEKKTGVRPRRPRPRPRKAF